MNSLVGKKIKKLGRHIPVTQALKRLRKENLKFKANLTYTVRILSQKVGREDGSGKDNCCQV